MGRWAESDTSDLVEIKLQLKPETIKKIEAIAKKLNPESEDDLWIKIHFIVMNYNANSVTLAGILMHAKEIELTKNPFTAMRAAKAAKSEHKQELKQGEKPSYEDLIRYFVEHKPPISCKDLAEQFQYDVAAISGMISYLVRMKTVSRDGGWGLFCFSSNLKSSLLPNISSGERVRIAFDYFRNQIKIVPKPLFPNKAPPLKYDPAKKNPVSMKYLEFLANGGEAKVRMFFTTHVKGTFQELQTYLQGDGMNVDGRSLIGLISRLINEGFLTRFDDGTIRAITVHPISPLKTNVSNPQDGTLCPNCEEKTFHFDGVIKIGANEHEIWRCSNKLCNHSERR